jgi:hypothetical protein
MSNAVKVKFVDFWATFKLREQPLFYEDLVLKYNLQLSDKPDILIYSVFGREHENENYKDCVKIFYSAENNDRYNVDAIKKINQGHYIIGFENINHERCLFFHNITVIDRKFKLFQHKTQCENKSEFCSFIQRNCKCDYRNSFVKKLSKYKIVDCLGSCMNNVPRQKRNNNFFETILELNKNYKFNIAFENSSRKNYCTEKIWWAFLNKSVPIYWGDPNVDEYFYPDSFLSRHKYESDEHLIEAIKELDTNKKLYSEIVNSDKVKDPNFFSINRFHDFIEKILNENFKV